MNLSDYQPASIGGVSVLVPRNSGNFGRNAIEHLYPDSEQHYVEDNGRLLRKYSFPAVVHGKKVKSDFLALQAVIERPGPTTVVHPNFGAIFVQMGDCSFDITQKDAGVVNIQINCCEAGSPALPSLVTGSGAAIGGLTAKALIAMADLFKANFKKPLSAVSLNTIKDTLSNVTTSLDSVFRSANGMPELTADVQALSNLYNPDRLAASLQNIYRAPVKDDEIESDDLYRGWSKVIRTIEPVYEPFDVTTVDLRDREQSLATVQSFMHSASLIHFCESVSYFEYTTADQVIADRRRVLDAHSLVLETVYPAAKQLIDEVVTETFEYLSDLQVQLPRIETMNLTDWPVGAIAYQLYGSNTDNTQVLIDINQDRNLMLYNDREVSVLRDGG